MRLMRERTLYGTRTMRYPEHYIALTDFSLVDSATPSVTLVLPSCIFPLLPIALRLTIR